MTDETIELK